MTNPPLSKGRLIRLSKKYFQLNPETKQLHYPSDIKAFFIDRIQTGEDSKRHSIFRGETLVSAWFVSEYEMTPFLYIDYWGFDIKGHQWWPQSDGVERPMLEHHFRILHEDKLYDLIFCVESDFPIVEVFEVVQ